MTTARKHSCVVVPVAPSRKRQVNRPRCVLPSGSKLKQTEDVRPSTSGRCASAPSTQGLGRSGRSDASGSYWNMLRNSPETRPHAHGLSGGDASYHEGLMNNISGRSKIIRGDAEIDDKNKIPRNELMKNYSSTNLMESKKFMGFEKEINRKHNNITITEETPLRLRRSSSEISTESPSSVQEIYRNHNFKMPSDHALRYATDNWATVDNYKRTLEPIPETTETTRSRASTGAGSHSRGLPENMSRIDSAESEDLPVRNEISDVTSFRKKFFFECHSAEDMLRRKASALKDPDHRCSYRFYLNERLFPVPLYSDHENTIRCTDCCLPMHLDPSSNRSHISGANGMNGTIQAKIRIGKEKELQDIILLLPAKDNLLVLEKHTNTDKVFDENIVHFGILKIDNRRSTLAKAKVPDNSLALCYQKGFRKYKESSTIRFSEADKDNVIYL